jgi:pilus assembly protein FimV
MELARELGATRGEAPAGEWDKVLIMGRQLAPEDPLFAGAVRSSADTLDMELRSGESALDMDLPDLGTGTDVDINLREPGATLAEGGLDFVLDEPVRGTDVDESLAPTIESPRIKPVPSDEQTAEVPIEDLGLDVAELEDLGDLADLEAKLQKKVEAEAGDTVERAALSDDDGAADDLLSSTSIMGGSTLVAALGEPPAGTDGAGATAELPNLGPDAREATGYLEQPDFPTDAESATMSEVGTKLDLARAYVDMGDPEGARSILEEVLKEGNANQRKQAERLLAGLP